MSGDLLPPQWVRATVEQMCDILSGYGFPTRLQGRSEGEVPFFKVGDISNAWRDGSCRLREAQHYLTKAEAESIRAKALPVNTIVFAKIGEAISLNRRAVLDVPGIVDNNCMGVWAAPDRVDPRFLFHFMCTTRLGDASRASVVPSLRKSDVGDLQIPVPPLPEQRRIVAKIEELFSDLDAGVAALERVRANLKRYRGAVLKAAVEGRLTEEWRRRNPVAPEDTAAKLLERILSDRRAKWEQDQLRKFKEAGKTPPKGWREKYKSPIVPDVGALPPVMSGWVWATADQLCSQVTDGEHIQPPYQPTGKPMLTATHVRNDGVVIENVGLIAEADFEKCLKRCAPAEGDVLIVSVGATTGRAGVVGPSEPFAIVRSVLLLKPLVPSKYLLRWIQSAWCQHWIARASGASAQAHFYISDTKRMPVPLPPLAEQSAIVAEVDRRLSVADAAEQQVEHALQRAARLRQSILKRAFEGRLVPQYPADEPAAKMLDRTITTTNGHRAVIETSDTPRRDTPKRRSRARA